MRPCRQPAGTSGASCPPAAVCPHMLRKPHPRCCCVPIALPSISLYPAATADMGRRVGRPGPGPRPTLLLLLALLALQAYANAAPERQASWDYSALLSPKRASGIAFDDLPGFTRSVYERNYALVTPESHVWAGNPRWTNATTAHLISPAVGANFAMLLANMGPASSAAPPPEGHERFIFVLDGVVEVSAGGERATLHADGFAYLPAHLKSSIVSAAGAGLVVYERRYALPKSAGVPRFLHSTTQEQAVLPVPGEVFALRKLLPQTPQYDFNIHVMDFLPGQYLNVKEVHYNQHGLLLLQGQGIYRLGSDWYPVQSGDAIWMAPFVPQWYAALGTQESRYILYKDVSLDPLEA